jgi:predicted cupin superfamily sugar epimerase
MLFVGTRDAPVLYFGINMSDHVHYHRGGGSYTYIVVLPYGKVQEVTLGGTLSRDEKLQIVFPAWCFKAGYLNGDYCVIGEGEAPGFDFHDFAFVDEEALRTRLKQQLGREKALQRYADFVKPDWRRTFRDYYTM